MPPPPPTFSMTTCCPSASEIPTAKTRPAVSDELPAAKGTTMVTGRVGQFCANVVLTAPMVASAETAASAKCLRLNMIRSSDVVLGCVNKSKKHASPLL
jgi:hypothetical protein